LRSGLPSPTLYLFFIIIIILPYGGQLQHSNYQNQSILDISSKKISTCGSRAPFFRLF